MTYSNEFFLILCGLAGALHVIAPDHWMPASLLAWQGSWSRTRGLAFATGAFALHVALGAGVFFIASGVLTTISRTQFFGFSAAFVALVALMRGFRFGRVREVLRNGSRGVWGAFMVFSLLGPAESLVPVLLKAYHSGSGYLAPIVAFFAGTVLMGFGLILFGRRAWNRPLWLTRSMQWAQRRMAVVPVVGGIAVGLSFIFQWV